jgi:hypothetical protein
MIRDCAPPLLRRTRRTSPRTAYMSTLHVKPPNRSFFFSFFPCHFLLFDRAAGFLPPRPRIVAAAARSSG